MANRRKPRKEQCDTVHPAASPPGRPNCHVQTRHPVENRSQISRNQIRQSPPIQRSSRARENSRPGCSLVSRRSKLSTKNKITIYRTIIRPAMMYSVAVWGNVAYTQLQKLQVVRNKFLRAAFNAPWFVRIAQLHREANLPTIREYRQDVAGKFFENAANHPNPLVREAVNYDENVAYRYPRPKCVLLRQD
jgi:hypothetical protein